MQTVLILFKNDGERRDFPLAGEMTTIGRDRSCALRIPKAEVSRQHCVLQHTGGNAEVRDTGSTNGTFVNGVRVDRAAIEAGDELTIGPVTFVIQIDGEPADVTPPTYMDDRFDSAGTLSGVSLPGASVAGESALDLSGGASRTAPGDSREDSGVMELPADGDDSGLDLSFLDDDDDDD